jgi:chromosome segregation protein
MFLKALTLKGFKSFADATTIALEPGVAVVVGPNGSGKSNVVDAIAWVLGAQAPSAVRSQKMDDVIFAGTAKRPPLGRAEVSLTIDNSAGLLPIEFSEVTVSRTLWRTGESEYAINGVPCRLLDVQELLSDTGVGRQQHVIVSQGQIDAVLNARPEERRSIVEEAAGVLKYRKRKEKAERRLEATEGNLLRVSDLLREVRRQLRPLERQAEAARRHGDLVGELTALRVHLSGREIAGLRTRLQTLANDRATLAGDEQAVRGELARLDTDVLATEAKLAAMGAADLGDALVRVEQLRERARGIAAVLGERRRSMARDRGRLLDTDLVATLEAEAAAVRDELDAVVLAAATLPPREAELELQEAALAAERADAERTAPEDVSPSRAAAEVRGELRTHRAALERAQAEARRLDQRLADLAERAARLEEATARYRAECEGAEATEQPLVDELESAEARRLAADGALAAAEEARAEAATAYGTWSARAEALALALDEARARAGAERLGSVPGVVGTLLDLVDVDDGWEAAFEAAAGEALSAVVVDGVDAARRALDLLAREGSPGAVLALGAALAPAAPVVTPAVGSPVLQHVRASDPAVARLLVALLAPAVVVDGSWAGALDAALAHPEAVVVTRAGDRFGAGGWRLQVAGTGATGAALDEARARADQAAADLARRDDVLRLARAEHVAARQAEAEVGRRLDASDARFSAAADALARVQGERRDVATEVEALQGSRAEVAERLGREQARVAELEAVLPGLEADETAEAEHARARQMVRARLDERSAALVARRRELAVEAAGVAERRQFLERRLGELEERLQADADARVEAEARRVALERSLAAVDRLSELVDAHRSMIEAHHDVLAERRRRQSDEARAVTQHLDELRRLRHAAEQRLDATRERQRRNELDEAEVKVRLEGAVDVLRRELDTEPEAAMTAECPPLVEGVTAAARVRDLDRELRLLGPINPLALEEFTALQERHAFLEEQLEDVRTTRRELLRVIKAVDAEIQSVFAAAYADVAGNFERLFATLFPGGSGKLVLTNPDDLLNTGVEVEAKPSGKNVKKLSLLSGGERSLTALAFLFAVFRARPSPFYVMDEVEAALDDVNLHRFLGLVDEFRNEAQLLIVSHQKRTMEAADCLFGVTMQPGGSSKVVSERIRTQA